MSATKTDIMISTRLTGNPTSCRFQISENVYEGGAAFFQSKEEAAGSPLAAKIFEIESITSVKIAGKVVTVSRHHPEDWPSVTRKVAELIKAQIHSSEPAVKDGAASSMRSPEEIKKIANEVLDAEINPSVASHGGHIEILDVKETTVYVKMGGGCQGCGQASNTLKQGVERALRDKLPELDEVLDTTDHAGGTNPYYAPSSK